MKTVIIIKSSKTLKSAAYTVLLMSGTLMLATYLLVSPASAADSVRGALSVCAASLIPSLFPFAVLVGIMNGTGISSRIADAVGAPIGRMLGIGRGEVYAFFLGNLGGFPIGAVCVRELYDNGQISISAAERLLALSSGASPTFCIAALGSAMFKSRIFGVKLYLCQLAAILIIALFMRPSARVVTSAPYIRPQSLSAALTVSVGNAALTMLKVCAFAVFFAVIGDAVCSLTASYLGDSASAFTAALLELSLAGRRASALSGTAAVAVAAFAAGWSGISVHMQIASVMHASGIGMKIFRRVKLLQGVISAILMLAVCSLE